MPTLHLRTLGVSYAVEGLLPCGSDAEQLLLDLTARHGEAAAPVGVPIEAVLLDWKAADWNEFQDWLESWVRSQGFAYVSWTRDAALPAGSATLHFH